MRPVEPRLTLRRWRTARMEADRLLLGPRVAGALELEGPEVHPSLRAAAIRFRAWRGGV